MQHQTVTDSPNGARPGRAQIEPAALALLSRHSAGLLAFARRYSMTPEDAEDAYQRGVEILLTKAPTTSEDELLPWLRTVVKHEAYAVRRCAGRALPAAEPLESDGTAAAWTDDRAERYEQLRLGAEAMAGLKPQEIRCLILKAEGLSYNEICETTGFSYTKVNRCITEGRRSFLKRVARIESGAVCEMLAPLISKVADGEASAEEMRTVRPHLKGCLACKATLREYRETPARLAALVPPVAALAGANGGTTSFLGRLLASAQERVAGMSELASAKLAVAGSAVVLAGGGAVGMQAAHPDPPAVPASAYARNVVDGTKRADPTPIRASAAADAIPAVAMSTRQGAAALGAAGRASAGAAEADDGSGADAADAESADGPSAASEFDPGVKAPASVQPAPEAEHDSERGSQSEPPAAPQRGTSLPEEFAP